MVWALRFCLLSVIPPLMPLTSSSHQGLSLLVDDIALKMSGCIRPKELMFKYEIDGIVVIIDKRRFIMTEERNIVYIGRKPIMNYVTAIITGFSSSGTSELVVKARGRAISSAVDAVEVARRRFMKNLEVSKITIGTENVTEEDGRLRAVSTMEIVLAKQEAKAPVTE